jgi:hypothetical protein
MGSPSEHNGLMEAAAFECVGSYDGSTKNDSRSFLQENPLGLPSILPQHPPKLAP